jgi:galactose-1-phosphate uridylyltransferase
MPELRQNYFTKESVIIAAERAKRPEELASKRPAKVVPPFVEACPFCAGNESKASPEVMRFPANRSEPWQVRVVANKFAALSLDIPPGPSIAPAAAWEALASTTSLSTRPTARTRLPKCQMRTWPTSCASTSLAPMH